VSQKGAGPLENDGTIGRARAAEKLAELQSSEDVRWLLSDPRGRRAVARWTKGMGALSTTGFLHSGSEMYFREGSRDLANRIREDCLKAAPDLFAALEHETVDTVVRAEIEARGITHQPKEQE
jgi:hypothetical protein